MPVFCWNEMWWVVSILARAVMHHLLSSVVILGKCIYLMVDGPSPSDSHLFLPVAFWSMPPM